MGKKKRVKAISDPHCGHRVGLTPPKYDPKPSDPKLLVWWYVRRALWREYLRMIKPCDILFVLGDCVDGRGEKSGSTELLYTDRKVQCAMAAECINMWHAKKIVMVFGTAYHVGDKEDWEEQIADRVKADKIGDEEFVRVDDITFSLKHHISSSGIPHGKGTPIAKDWLWNLVWSLRDEQPLADIFLRGHQHSFDYIGNDSFLGIVLPALQGLWSKFGSRIPSKRVDFGTVWFDVMGDKFTWDWDIVAIKEQKAKVLQF